MKMGQQLTLRCLTNTSESHGRCKAYLKVSSFKYLKAFAILACWESGLGSGIGRCQKSYDPLLRIPDRNQILTISSKFRRLSFVTTTDRPSHPSIHPAERGQRKK